MALEAGDVLIVPPNPANLVYHFFVALQTGLLGDPEIAACDLNLIWKMLGGEGERVEKAV